MPTSRLLISRLPILLLGCGLTLTACAGLDSKKISERILGEINQQGGITVKAVKCPQEIAVKVGETFGCRGEIEATKTFPIKVHLKDEQGDVAWEIPNTKTVLNLRNLESQFKEILKTQTGSDTEVKCGSEAYRLNVPGESFECATVKQGKQGSIKVQVDPQGNVNWNEVLDIPVAKGPAAAQSKTDSKSANPSNPTPQSPVSQAASPLPATAPESATSPEKIVDPGDGLADVTED